MNVLTVPKWLSRDAEPSVPPLPAPRPEEMRQMTMDFMNAADRQREENAYLRSENEQLRVDVKAAIERARMLETELNFTRDDRDRLLQHDSEIMKALGIIKNVIVAEEANARANAYAPPGSGQQQPEQPTAQEQQILTGLAEKLAPEGGNA